MSSDSQSPEPEQAKPSESEKRPRGRPKSGHPPLSAAEKQRAYRQRKRATELAAYTSPEGKPTQDVVKALGKYLSNLDNPAKTADRELDHGFAERAIQELCKRYALKRPR